MRIGTFFSIIVWFFLVVQGHARDVQVGKTWLHINPPQGYCELDPTQPADAALLQFSHTENLLLSHSVDCIELADYRSGKREFIDHFAKQVVLAAFVDAPPEANPLFFLDTLYQKARATGGSVDAKTEAEIKAKIEKYPVGKVYWFRFSGSDRER